jgi:hypothetical protein
MSAAVSGCKPSPKTRRWRQCGDGYPNQPEATPRPETLSGKTFLQFECCERIFAVTGTHRRRVELRGAAAGERARDLHARFLAPPATDPRRVGFPLRSVLHAPIAAGPHALANSGAAAIGRTGSEFCGRRCPAAPHPSGRRRPVARTRAGEYRRRKLRYFGCRPCPMAFVKTLELVGFQRRVAGAPTLR